MLSAALTNSGIAQGGADDFEQAVVLNGFLEKGDGAGLRGFFAGFGIFAAGNNDNRDLLDGFQAMKPVHDAETIPRYAADFWRKTDVQEDQIRPALAGGGHGLGTVHGSNNLIASPLQL